MHNALPLTLSLFARTFILVLCTSSSEGSIKWENRSLVMESRKPEGRMKISKRKTLYTYDFYFTSFLIQTGDLPFFAGLQVERITFSRVADVFSLFFFLFFRAFFSFSFFFFFFVFPFFFSFILLSSCLYFPIRKTWLKMLQPRMIQHFFPNQVSTFSFLSTSRSVNPPFSFLHQSTFEDNGR